MTFSFARPEDAQDLLAVYAQYIHTPVTFEYDLPSPETFRDRILDYGSTYPYLVAREGGAVLGYAYAHRQAERAAYQWNAELSVYLDRNHLSRGLGAKAVRRPAGASHSPGRKNRPCPGIHPQREKRGAAPGHGVSRFGRPAGGGV